MVTTEASGQWREYIPSGPPNYYLKERNATVNLDQPLRLEVV